MTLNADAAALYSREEGSNGSAPPEIPSNNRNNDEDSQPWNNYDIQTWKMKVLVVIFFEKRG